MRNFKIKLVTDETIEITCDHHSGPDALTNQLVFKNSETGSELTIDASRVIYIHSKPKKVPPA